MSCLSTNRWGERAVTRLIFMSKSSSAIVDWHREIINLSRKHTHTHTHWTSGDWFSHILRVIPNTACLCVDHPFACTFPAANRYHYMYEIIIYINNAARREGASVIETPGINPTDMIMDYQQLMGLKMIDSSSPLKWKMAVFPREKSLTHFIPHLSLSRQVWPSLFIWYNNTKSTACLSI